VANASRIKDYSAELVKSVPDIIVANGSPVLAASFSWSSTIQWSKALFSAWRTRGATSPGSYSSISPFSGGRFTKIFCAPAQPHGTKIGLAG
jgi:hypothetical protein